jgi:hypothetical protein
MQLNLIQLPPLKLTGDERTRRCKKCGEVKSIEYFEVKHISNIGTPQVSNRCKACVKQQGRLLSRLKARYPAPPPGTLCMVPNCKNEAKCLDHDHATGQARDYICAQHNSAFGFCGDSVTGVMDLLEYAKRWEK